VRGLDQEKNPSPKRAKEDSKKKKRGIPGKIFKENRFKESFPSEKR